MVDALIYLAQMLLSGRLCFDACGVKHVCKLLNIGKRHDFGFMAINHVKQFASVDDRPPSVAFQRCTMQENNYRKELIDGHTKESSQCFDVRVVLLEGIAEMVSVAVHVLRPLVCVVIAVNPARVVFGFNNKNTVSGNHDVVYLHRIAVALEIDIIPKIVFVGQRLENRRDGLFATPASVFGLAWQLFCEVEHAYGNRNRYQSEDDGLHISLSFGEKKKRELLYLIQRL